MCEWTEDSAESKGAVLRAFASKLPAGKAAAHIAAADLQNYHDALLQRLSDTTVVGYMMAIRSFFNWSIDVRKIRRRNPMDGVKIVKTEGKARQDFADYDLRDKLISEAPNDDLCYILFAGFHWGCGSGRSSRRSRFGSIWTRRCCTCARRRRCSLRIGRSARSR